jgi:hypothetical protein
MENTTEEAERRGFIQGIAWAISLAAKYQTDAGGLLKESGISYVDFKSAKVVSEDLRQLRKVFQIEGIKLR